MLAQIFRVRLILVRRRCVSKIALNKSLGIRLIGEFCLMQAGYFLDANLESGKYILQNVPISMLSYIVSLKGFSHPLFVLVGHPQCFVYVITMLSVSASISRGFTYRESYMSALLQYFKTAVL